MLLEYDKVTQSSPLISNARSVGPVRSPVGNSVIVLEFNIKAANFISNYFCEPNSFIVW